MKCRTLSALFVLFLLPAFASANDSPAPEPTTPYFAIGTASDLPAFAAHRDAQQTCPNAGTIASTGNVNHLVSLAPVTREPVTTSCSIPNCRILAGCGDPCGYCACRAAGYSALQCVEGC